MSKTTLSKQERKQKKQQQERIFSVIALIVVAVTVLVILGIIVGACINRAQKVQQDELYGCWYSEDGEACWRFGEDEDVYLFGREDTAEPFLFSSYTDYMVDEQASTITIFFGKSNPTVFTCRMRGDKLIMKNADSTLVFERGIDIAEYNKGMVGGTSPESLPSKSSPSPAQ